MVNLVEALDGLSVVSDFGSAYRLLPTSSQTEACKPSLTCDLNLAESVGQLIAKTCIGLE